MKKIISIIFFAVFLSLTCFSQSVVKAFSKEITGVTDNDNYLLTYHDGYYTNGLYFTFRNLLKPKTLPKQKIKTEKIIMSYEIGQMIFNPETYTIVNAADVDRPFTGFLFGKVMRTKFYENENILKYGVMLGTIGPAAQGEKVQRWYHRLIHIYDIPGWGNQLNNEVSLTFNAEYDYHLFRSVEQKTLADATAFGKINFGNAFTNLSVGSLLRFGSLEKNYQSCAWNSRLHRSTPNYLRKSEAFLFFQPELIYQIYNATVQGGLFRKNKGGVVSEIKPLIFQPKFGFAYSQGRMTVLLAYIHKSKEAKTMHTPENYGEFSLSYRFN